jgi:hypothetical protein
MHHASCSRFLGFGARAWMATDALHALRCARAFFSAADAAAFLGDDGGDFTFAEVEVDSDGEEATAARARRGAGGGGAAKAAPGKAARQADVGGAGGKAPRRRTTRNGAMDA